jgi:hypothetical protein
MPLITQELADAEARVKRFNTMMSDLAQGTNALLTHTAAVQMPTPQAVQQVQPQPQPEPVPVMQMSQATAQAAAQAVVQPVQPVAQQVAQTVPQAVVQPPVQTQPVSVSEFEIIPDKKPAVNSQNKQVMRRTGPRMFNFGFTINPVNYQKR